jgi:hypothetical protein
MYRVSGGPIHEKEVGKYLRSIGRTFPDLVVEYKNDARVMTTVLTIVPFVIYAPKSLCEFIYPILAAVIFNGVWFFTPYIANLWGTKRGRWTQCDNVNA